MEADPSNRENQVVVVEEECHRPCRVAVEVVVEEAAPCHRPCLVVVAEEEEVEAAVEVPAVLSQN